MPRTRHLLMIGLISFACALALGMIDKETQSLWHLLTAEPGNIVALGLYTGLFSMIGVGTLMAFRAMISGWDEAPGERTS